MPPSPSRPRNKARIKANLGGHRAEWLASCYLRLKFYRIIARRYKTRYGEIDLIVERFGTIAFVEVKARRSAAAEFETMEAINTRRIMEAAEHWIARHPRHAEKTFRFDVIFLAQGRWPRHVINAFHAG